MLALQLIDPLQFTPHTPIYFRLCTEMVSLSTVEDSEHILNGVLRNAVLRYSFRYVLGCGFWETAIKILNSDILNQCRSHRGRRRECVVTFCASI